VKRDELIAKLEAARGEVEATLAGLDAAQLQAPGVVGDWSVKDLLAHITAWEVDLLTNLGKARRGVKVPRIKWTDAAIEAQNQKWHAEMKERPLERVRADFDGARRQLLRQLGTLSEGDLASTPAWLGQPLAGYVESYALDHELEHLQQMRAWRERTLGSR
jgi:uncharacterized damage-inducible protein DinB